jgi:hypothetical protein
MKGPVDAHRRAGETPRVTATTTDGDGGTLYLGITGTLYLGITGTSA